MFTIIYAPGSDVLIGADGLTEAVIEETIIRRGKQVFYIVSHWEGSERVLQELHSDDIKISDEKGGNNPVNMMIN